MFLIKKNIKQRKTIENPMKSSTVDVERECK